MIDEEYDSSKAKRFEYANAHDLNVFDANSLKGIERLEIEGDCFIKVNRFVIDGLNELKSVNIGMGCFGLYENKIMRISCLIMNCDQLSEIHFGYKSFNYYESFELKNLPSLISIQLDGDAFYACQRIVFDSMNDWMNDEWDLIRVESIILVYDALYGDEDSVDRNELIMKSMNDDNWLIRSSFSIFIKRIW